MKGVGDGRASGCAAGLYESSSRCRAVESFAERSGRCGERGGESARPCSRGRADLLPLRLARRNLVLSLSVYTKQAHSLLAECTGSSQSELEMFCSSLSHARAGSELRRALSHGHPCSSARLLALHASEGYVRRRSIFCTRRRRPHKGRKAHRQQRKERTERSRRSTRSFSRANGRRRLVSDSTNFPRFTASPGLQQSERASVAREGTAQTKASRTPCDRRTQTATL